MLPTHEEVFCWSSRNISYKATVVVEERYCPGVFGYLETQTTTLPQSVEKHLWLLISPEVAILYYVAEPVREA